MSIAHIENGTVLKLRVIEERIEGSRDLRVTLKEWDPTNFVKVFGDNLLKKPYCLRSNEEFQFASSTIRAWAEANSKRGSEILLDKYEEELKQLIINEFPRTKNKMYQDAWDIFMDENQNGMTDFFIFKEPVTKWEDISIKFLVGFQVINPFITEMDKKYKTLYIKGSPSRIDAFRKEFIF